MEENRNYGLSNYLYMFLESQIKLFKSLYALKIELITMIS